MSELLKTPLTPWHVENGAKMAPEGFAGFDMPLYYPTGWLKEVHAVRNFAGMFDISHMRPIRVEGTLAREFLDFVDTRDLSEMKIGDAKYGTMCNDFGEPLDDIIVYMLDTKSFLVIANASNGTRISEHFRNVKIHNKMSNEEVTITDGFGKFGFLSLQGPNAEAILLQTMSGAYLPKKYYSCRYGIPFGYRALIAKTGYTGEEGYEILCSKMHALEIWVKLLEVGEPFGLIPACLAARDTLRLEAGMPLFGHEMDKDHDPITAGLGWAVNFEKMYFIGKDALLKVQNGTSKKPREYFHAFEMKKGRVPRHGDNVYFKIAGQYVKTGFLTSAGFSPTLEKNIAMGYSKSELRIGAEVYIEIGGKLYPATVTNRPFYKRAKK
jgi:aminomethyltransferase